MNPRTKPLGIFLAAALGMGLTLVILGSLMVVPVVYATGITVNTTDDELNSDGDCSLREAVKAANLDTAVDSCTPGSGSDVIQFSLPNPSQIVLTLGQILIKNDPLTMSGPGVDQLSISGNDSSRIFDIAAGIPVTLTDMTLQNGFTTLDGGAVRSGGALTVFDAVLVNNVAEADGGAIDVDADLTLHNTDVLSNTASGEGGGVNAFGLQTEMTNGRFANNFSGSYGGGLYVNKQLTINGTQFISNTANLYAGAVWTSDDATISGATFERNTAKNIWIGAVYAAHDLEVTNSSFISNTAGNNIGAVWVNEDATIVDVTFSQNVAGVGRSGALQVSGSLWMTNTQFVANEAGASGSALLHKGNNGRLVNTLFADNEGIAAAFEHSGNVEILHSTIAMSDVSSDAAITIDSTGSLDIQNSIFSGFATGLEVMAGTVSENYNLFHNIVPVSGSVTRGEHSYFGDPAFVDAANGDFHLSANSEALNTAVDASIAADVDGDARPGGSGIDSGYDETTFVSDVSITKAAFVTPGPNQPIKYTLTFANAGTAMLPRLTITDRLPVWLTQPITISSSVLMTDVSGTLPYVWQVHNLAPGATGVITVSSVLTDVLPQSFTNTVTIRSIATEINVANNTDDAVVNVPNVGPIAVDDEAVIAEDEVTVFHVTANDIDGDVLFIDSFNQPGHGTAVLSGTQQIVYTPTLEYSGSDSFTYTVSDGQSSDSATVMITVTAVNDAPIISEGSLVTRTISEDNNPTPFNLTANATDVEGSPLTWLVLSQPAHGSANAAAGPANNSAISYTPTANYFGTDQFQVQVSDGELTDSVTISITIEPINDAPMAVDDTAVVLRKPSNDLLILAAGPSGMMNVLDNDIDVEDTSRSVIGVGDPNQGGNVSIDTDGTLLNYMPVDSFTGLEAFTYTMTDSVLESMAVVSMTVTEGIDGGVGGDAFAVPEMGDAQIFTVTVEIPDNVANGDNVALVFDTVDPTNLAVFSNNSAGSSAPGFNMEAAGLSFSLFAYLDGRLVDESYQFDEPIVLTLNYANAAVANIGPAENSLALYFAQKSGWANSGIQVVERDSSSHQVTFAVSHAGSFALFRQGFVFIPLVMNNFAQAPDLVVESLTVLSAGDQGGVPGDIQVVIANEGNGPVTEEFWVDLYIDPKTAPTGVNQTWQMMGDQGFVWGVTTSALPLQPGERITLTLSSPYAQPVLSNIKWPLEPGIPIDVQVDSAKVGSPYGAVRELHEIYSEPYNNIRRFYSSP